MTNNIYYIKTGWLIDGSGSAAQENVLLTIKDGIIDKISRFNTDDYPAPSLITDLSLCTILPPLVDCHVHLALSHTTNPDTRRHQLSINYNECKPQIIKHLNSLYSCGILAVRDAGDKCSHVFRYRNEIAKDRNTKNLILVKATTQVWHKKGRYGSFLGKAISEGEILTTAVANGIDSVDHIKLINSGVNSITEFAKETQPQFSFEEIENLVRHLRNKKIKLMVHANGRKPVRDAVEAGCHSIEHGFFIGTENLKRMADKQTFWVPTAVTMKTLLDCWESLKNTGDRDVIRKTLGSGLELMTKAKEYGVRLALGTDSGSRGIAHGKSMVDELELFMQAGYSLSEALQCASINGANLLDVKSMGTLTKGNPASFIAAKGAPHTLPRSLSTLEAIYIDGKSCDFNHIRNSV